MIITSCFLAKTSGVKKQTGSPAFSSPIFFPLAKKVGAFPLAPALSLLSPTPRRTLAPYRLQ